VPSCYHSRQSFPCPYSKASRLLSNRSDEHFQDFFSYRNFPLALHMTVLEKDSRFWSQRVVMEHVKSSSHTYPSSSSSRRILDTLHIPHAPRCICSETDKPKIESTEETNGTRLIERRTRQTGSAHNERRAFCLLNAELHFMGSNCKGGVSTWCLRMKVL
jgi:hypothetical protein